MTPTPEQEAIVAFARTRDDNLLISALAGTGKTSTLILLAKALSTTRILALAFNKRIADEMKDKLPLNCEARTMNAIGHRVWAEAIGQRFLKVDSNKMNSLLKAAIDKLPKAEKTLAFEEFGDILKSLRFAKVNGYVPDSVHIPHRTLISEDDFYADLDEVPSEIHIQLVNQVLAESIALALQGQIDFDDQIYMPTLFMGSFPQFPLVLIDEAQDLNSLQHVMLSKIARKRLIAVGDRAQAIYGFRGALENSMDELSQQFNMEEMHLSVSFRCPRAVVEAAKWRAPRMTSPEWAKEGQVIRLPSWTIDTIPDEAAIICRNNAPLFKMALQLLAARRLPEIVGGADIGRNLIKTMRKFSKDDSLAQDGVLDSIAVWLEEKLKKARNKRRFEDEAECMRVFAREGNTLGEALAYAEHIMNAAGRIKLLTGHKSKGLEFDNVYFLNEDLIRMTEEQDRNLKYVIITRAKDRLVYINSNEMEA